MSRSLIFLLAFCLTLAPPLSQASAQGPDSTAYLRLIEDVPLPQGYREAGEAVVFEGAGGRMVQTSASGRSDETAARRFYRDTLPALGWSSVPDADGALSFNRGRERLSIVFSEVLPPPPGVNSIQFRLVTRAASMSPD